MSRLRIILPIIFLLLVTCKPKKIEISDNVYIEGKDLVFYYHSAFQDSLYDKLHGFHKFAEYFACPGQLIEILKIFKNDEPRVTRLIEILGTEELSCSPANGVALLSKSYWELINKIKNDRDNYAILPANLRQIKIPLGRVQREVLQDFKEANLYISPITMMIDFAGTVNKIDVSVLGSSQKLIDYFETNMTKELQKFVFPANADVCDNYPFSNLPIDMNKAFDKFSNLGIEFGDFQQYLKQYLITPEIITSSYGRSPSLNFTFSTTSSPHTAIEIPIPITIKKKTQEELYVRNAVRAAVGNLLCTGIGREFTVIIELSDASHRTLFSDLIVKLGKQLKTDQKSIQDFNNREELVRNDKLIFYQLKLIPVSAECNSIKAINLAIIQARNILDEYIKEKSDVKFRYAVSKEWPQLIVVKPIAGN